MEYSFHDTKPGKLSKCQITNNDDLFEVIFGSCIDAHLKGHREVATKVECLTDSDITESKPISQCVLRGEIASGETVFRIKTIAHE